MKKNINSNFENVNNFNFKKTTTNKINKIPFQFENDKVQHQHKQLQQKQDQLQWHECTPKANCYCSKNPEDRLQQEYDWHFFDKIVCISVESRSDRQQKVEEEFHRVGLCTKIVFYRPKRNNESPVAGCWESHRYVMIDALNNGCNNVCIFEDDVTFRSDFRPHVLNDIRDVYLQLPKNWKSYFLGHWPFFSYSIMPNMRRTISMTTHAYVANKCLMEVVKETPYNSRKENFIRKCFGPQYDAIDGFVRSQGNQYAYYTMVAYQSGAKSSITNGDFYEFFLTNPKYMRFAETFTCEYMPYFATVFAGYLMRAYFTSNEECVC